MNINWKANKNTSLGKNPPLTTYRYIINQCNKSHTKSRTKRDASFVWASTDFNCLQPLWTGRAHKKRMQKKWWNPFWSSEMLTHQLGQTGNMQHPKLGTSHSLFFWKGENNKTCRGKVTKTMGLLYKASAARNRTKQHLECQSLKHHWGVMFQLQTILSRTLEIVYHFP
jgi:hypothetical protein